MTKSVDSPFSQSFDTFEVIGSGKFATVKRCVHRQTGRQLAAKFIRKRSSSGRMGQPIEDINREIEILKAIDHEHIIKIYEFFHCGNEVVLILELVNGGQLFDLLLEREALTEAETVCFMRQILSAVKHLHDRNIVHLDLKPENILLNEAKQIKVIDFGISRTLDHKSDVKGFYGTPEFIAPEIVSYEAVSTATDMWAIGCIAYNLLTGVSPFLGETKQDTFANITAVNYLFDQCLFCQISDLAKDFISHLLVKNQKKRFSVNDCLSHKWIENNEIEVNVNKVCDIETKLKLKWKKAIDSVVICLNIIKQYKNKLKPNKEMSSQTDIFE